MSLVTDNTLPTDVEQLQQLVLSQQLQLSEKDALLESQQQQLNDKTEQLSVSDELIAERDQLIAELEEKLALLLAKRYLRSSEKLSAVQLKLFDESELEQAIAEVEKELQAAAASPEKKNTAGSDSGTTTPKPKPRRKPLPEHLRRVELIVDVSDEEKARMGDDWVQIGFEESEQLAVHDREYYVKRLKRCKYVRKEKASSETESVAIKVAPPAKVMLPKSQVDATVLAKIVTGKFVDALSFYREHRVLAREGIEIGYSTLCHYPIQLYDRLESLRLLLFGALSDAKRWHLDETTVQVLKEPDRAAGATSYMWCNRAIFDGGGELVLFHYNARRNYDALEEWLAPALSGFSGVIVSDEHKPYEKLAREYPSIAARGGCWSHARRKFSDAVKGRRHGSDAHKMLKEIAKLFKLDNRMQSLSGEELLEARAKHIKPWCDDFKVKIDAMAADYPDKGLMKTATGYVINNWTSLTAFLTHPDLVITNNPAENAIRPFTIGRKNWMFSGGPRGAKASALMYTLVESAKANGLEPKRYLTELFERFPHAENQDEVKSLLPHNFKF